MRRQRERFQPKPVGAEVIDEMPGIKQARRGAAPASPTWALTAVVRPWWVALPGRPARSTGPGCRRSGSRWQRRAAGQRLCVRESPVNFRLP